MLENSSGRAGGIHCWVNQFDPHSPVYSSIGWMRSLHQHIQIFASTGSMSRSITMCWFRDIPGCSAISWLIDTFSSSSINDVRGLEGLYTMSHTPSCLLLYCQLRLVSRWDHHLMRLENSNANRTLCRTGDSPFTVHFRSWFTCSDAHDLGVLRINQNATYRTGNPRIYCQALETNLAVCWFLYPPEAEPIQIVLQDRDRIDSHS